MASIPKHLAHITFGSSLQTLYTVPEDTKVIPSFRMTNCGSPATVRLYAVPPEGIPGVENVIYYDHRLEAGESFGESSGIVMEAGWTLQGYASQNGIIGMTLSGLEVTE